MSFNPTFLIKGVIPDKFDISQYSQLSLEQVVKLFGTKKINTKPIVNTAVSSICSKDNVYLLRSRSGQMLTMVSSNCDAYTRFLKQPQTITGRCRWCDRIRPNVKMMGIPINISIQNGDYLIDYVDLVCSYSCALSLWRKDYQSDGRFRRSENYIRFLSEYEYPGKPLEFAPHPSLLLCHGGSLTDQEYDKGMITDCINFIYLPAKTIAIKQ